MLAQISSGVPHTSVACNVRPWNGRSSEWERGQLARFAKSNRIPLDVPWRELRPEQREAVLEGEGTYRGHRYPGLRAWFRWMESRTYKMHVRVLLSRYRAYTLCTTCDGARLNPDALRYRVGGLDLVSDGHNGALGERDLQEGQFEHQVCRPDAGHAACDLRDNVQAGEGPRQFAASGEGDGHGRIEVRAGDGREHKDQHDQDRPCRNRIAKQCQRNVSARKLLRHDPRAYDGCEQERGAEPFGDETACERRHQ